MANLDDLKKIAKDALGTIADVSVEAYKVAEEKAKVVARRAILNTEIAREKALIRRRYAEIGKAYYEQRKDDPEELHKQSCEDITNAMASIEAKRAEIEDLKASAADDADFESAPHEVPKQESRHDPHNNHNNKDHWQ